MVFAAAADGQTWVPNPQEQALAELMVNAGSQHRPFMVMDPILAKVARERATDMARRHYFDHTNPDGHGVNYLVRKGGYVLPSNYPSDGNNLESIAGGSSTASGTWSDWMGSSAHREHVLALNGFWASQTSYGVGYYEDPTSPYRFYWVVITAPPGAPTTSLTIETPGEGANVYEGSPTVSGSAGGNQPISSVQVAVQNAGGTSAYQTMNGTQAWGGGLDGLRPGPNVLRARSLGTNGAVLAEVVRNVRYVVYRPLTVAIEGQGDAGAFTGTTSREVGANYTIVARPAAGWLFAGWSGSWQGDGAAHSFTMKNGTAVTARFIPNPFLPVRGAYEGLIGASDSAHAERGFISLKLTGLGNFSGRAFFAGEGYPIIGRFGFDGHATVKLPRSDISPLKLKLTLDFASGAITGFVLDGELSISLDAARALKDAAAFAGRYTVSFPAEPGSTDASVPHGDGYAVLVVDSAGNAQLTGALADGRDFSRAGRIQQDGSLAIYLPLYQHGGSLTGVLTFADLSDRDIEGALRWTKPERAGAAHFAGGFDTTLPAIGARYTAPDPGHPVVSVAEQDDNARIILGDGGLDLEVVQPATIGMDNVVTVTTPALSGLSVQIKAQNGRFKGAFTHPVSGAVTEFRGVVLQKQNVGTGYFLGEAQSGYANLSPVQ